MLKKEILTDTLEICGLHHRRMMFAWERIKDMVPMNIEKYDRFGDEEIGYFDQLIYRFSKLQDTMGNKLFRLILEGLGEDVRDVPYIDILNKLEKLNILGSKDQWLMLRELRNEVTHEYPYNRNEIVEGLNELHDQCITLSRIWENTLNYCLEKFDITPP